MNTRITFEQQLGTRLKELCCQYQIIITDQILKKAGQHFALLLKWNQKIALTTLTDPLVAAQRLYFESFFAGKYITVPTKERVPQGVDIGSGAGFPGILLALQHPNVNYTLLESDRRKAAFLQETVATLELSNVKVIAKRFEEYPDSFDFITARALEKFSYQIPILWKKYITASQFIFFLNIPTAKELTLVLAPLAIDWQFDIVPLLNTKNLCLLIANRKS
jgi:16S rRNA (guanine527-N7)-methyltransferase